MKTLLMDVGNSYLKWSTLESGVLSKQQSVAHKKSTLDSFNEVLESHGTDCNEMIMVSVLGDIFIQAAEKITQSKNINFNNIHSQEELAGIKNAYLEPFKLGADRFVAMIGAYKLSNPNDAQLSACIVIDSGTATTIDAVTECGQHLGGVIMPGLDLCSGSLLDNTELLPLWNNESTEFTADFFSKETSQAIGSGCLLGLAGGIDSICNKMESELKKKMASKQVGLKKIICGGAARKVLPYMQTGYHLQENLLMLGLKEIKETKSK